MFYTSVSLAGDFVLYRGFHEGKPIKKKFKYRPTMFLSSEKETQYKTLEGQFLQPMKFGGMADCREFISTYKDVENFPIYGNSEFVYQFIGDVFPQDEIEYDMSLLKIAYIDIEVECENGFPKIHNPIERINAISVRIDGKTHVFGLGEFSIDDPNCVCHRHDDEKELLEDFMQYWEEVSPHIITGWNVKFFDIPYMYNRMKYVLGDREARRLSPWYKVVERKVIKMNREHAVYHIVGIPVLDYLDLYQTFTYVNRESYRLDHIANVELGEAKLSYSEYDGIADFYRKDFQKFIEYNIKDVELIVKLEEKLRLIELALALAYSAKVNYEDVFSQVRTWDAIIYQYLRNNGIQIPQKKKANKDDQYVGAYVKDPIVGMHDWVVSFDLNSLYPHLIMQYNISPETKMDFGEEKKQICPFTNETIMMRDGHRISVDNILAEDEKCFSDLKQRKLAGLSVAANGTCYRRDKQGFLPALMEKMYKDRKHYKKLMIDAQKRKQDDPGNSDIDFEIAKYHNFQLVRKIQLNSAYGAIGNQYFRYYDYFMAEAITTSGQLSIRWVADKLNSFLNHHVDTKDYDYVVASDTDSVYLRLGNLVDHFMGDEVSTSKIINFLDKASEKIILPEIETYFNTLSNNMNAFENKMIMEREVIAEKGVWTAKKRYMMSVWDSEGVSYKSPKLKIMGLETARSSTPQYVRDRLKEAIRIILLKDNDTLLDFIDDCKTEFFQLPIEDISFPRGCNGMEKYASEKNVYKERTPIAVKGSLVYNKLIKDLGLQRTHRSIMDGEKIKFCYLILPNPIHEKVISFTGGFPKEFKLDKYVDYKTQFQKSFLDPLSVIVNSVNWKMEKQNTLEDLFV